MGRSVAQKLIESHLVDGEMVPGSEIGLRIDQTLTQDATGTMVMLELEALGLDRVRTDVSVQYVDHNLLQADERNMADHLFLRSACQRFGLWYSMAGEPVYLRMPEIWGIRLAGELPAWVGAKDVILEMLRRHGVRGGIQRIVEYHGSGLAGLSAMDRHVIANMGAELGATATVFPADEQVRRFLRAEQREEDFIELTADPDASYDLTDEIDLSSLEPLIAKPSSPGNVVPVREAASAWGRLPPPGATACAPSRATPPAAQARPTTRCGSARPRPRPPPRSPAASPTLASCPTCSASPTRSWTCPQPPASTPPCWRSHCQRSRRVRWSWPRRRASEACPTSTRCPTPSRRWW